MAIGADGPHSPASSRMTKAAFFRARSPGVPERASPVDNLAGRFDISTRLQDDSRSDNKSLEGPPALKRLPSLHANGQPNYASSVGTAGHTPPLDMGLARNPTLSSDGPVSPREPSTNNFSPFAVMHTGSDGTAYEEDGYEASKESMGLASSSDEMLMSLLAGQAAVDCETLPIGGWEEVESWKKVCWMVPGALAMRLID